MRGSSLVSKPTKVLFIGGWGRSGSTVLERVLGQLKGFTSIGELREIWLRGVVEGRPCGCGVPFHDCQFWSAVGEQAFGGWEKVDGAELHMLRTRYDRPWSVPVAVGARVRVPVGAGFQRYRDSLTRLYRAIQQVSRADVIVDSSKLPAQAFIVGSVPSIDLRVVHLVRDSRGVAYSWQKWVQRSQAAEVQDYMLRFSPSGAGLRYLVYNGLTHLLRASRTPYFFLRYEDFVATPRQAVQEVVTFTGEVERDLSFLNGAESALRPTHSVDGNPMRFQQGPLKLRLDDDWKRNLGARDRLIVSAITSPLLIPYRYGLRHHA